MNQYPNKQPAEAIVREQGFLIPTPPLNVHSIWMTIQGEGPYAGVPAIFIRLAGCNLACPMCDTDYTNGRKWMSVEQIVADVLCVRQGSASLVVITGGEPLRQPIGPLVNRLLNDGFKVQLETNGTCFQPGLLWAHPRLTVVCSPKTHTVHKGLLPFVAAFKYVARAADLADDGLPRTALDNELATGRRLYRQEPGMDVPVYLQPAEELPEPGMSEQCRKMANVINLQAVVASCLAHGHRLCLQTHKIIGVQ